MVDLPRTNLGPTNPVIPPTTEVEDLKALLRDLTQQGAEQKALITAMLTSDILATED